MAMNNNNDINDLALVGPGHPLPEPVEDLNPDDELRSDSDSEDSGKNLIEPEDLNQAINDDDYDDHESANQIHNENDDNPEILSSDNSESEAELAASPSEDEAEEEAADDNVNVNNSWNTSEIELINNENTNSTSYLSGVWYTIWSVLNLWSWLFKHPTKKIRIARVLGFFSGFDTSLIIHWQLGILQHQYQQFNLSQKREMVEHYHSPYNSEYNNRLNLRQHISEKKGMSFWNKFDKDNLNVVTNHKDNFLDEDTGSIKSDSTQTKASTSFSHSKPQSFVQQEVELLKTITGQRPFQIESIPKGKINSPAMASGFFFGGGASTLGSGWGKYEETQNLIHEIQNHAVIIASIVAVLLLIVIIVYCYSLQHASTQTPNSDASLPICEFLCSFLTGALAGALSIFLCAAFGAKTGLGPENDAIVWRVFGGVCVAVAIVFCLFARYCPNYDPCPDPGRPTDGSVNVRRPHTYHI